MRIAEKQNEKLMMKTLFYVMIVKCNIKLNVKLETTLILLYYNLI